MTSEQQNNQGASEEAKQAQQLDQLTDHVQDREMNIDASMAAQIMTSLQASSDKNQSKTIEHITISHEDVQKIVYELEVTDDVAISALRTVAELDGNPKQDVVIKALKYLLASS